MAKRRTTNSTNDIITSPAVADDRDERKTSPTVADNRDERKASPTVADNRGERKASLAAADDRDERKASPAAAVSGAQTESSLAPVKSTEKTAGGGKRPKKTKPVGASGHRERLRNRFLESNPDTIEDYHLIELLLFYSIPRKDTRDEAVELMNRFGSLRRLFRADPHELESVEGIGKSSAVLIRLIHELMRRIDLDSLSSGLDCSDIDTLGRLLCMVMRQEQDEVMYLLALDGAKRLIKYKKLYQSHTSALNVFIRDITEYAISQHAEYIIISHNHPSGSILPSYRDEELTTNLLNGLKLLNIRLSEHIICSETAYYPIIRNRFG